MLSCAGTSPRECKKTNLLRILSTNPSPTAKVIHDYMSVIHGRHLVHQNSQLVDGQKISSYFIVNNTGRMNGCTLQYVHAYPCLFTLNVSIRQLNSYQTIGHRDFFENTLYSR